MEQLGLSLAGGVADRNRCCWQRGQPASVALFKGKGASTGCAASAISSKRGPWESGPAFSGCHNTATACPCVCVCPCAAAKWLSGR